MGRPKKRTGDDATTAERLLGAAEQEFAAKGLEGARLEDIAATVGITRASLLHHHGSKERLYAAVVGRVFQRLRDALVSGMASDGTFEARVDATVGRFCDHLFDDPAPAKLFVRELLGGRGPGAALLEEQLGGLFDLTEAFVRHQGGRKLPRDLDVRGAILDLVGAVLFRTVAGPLSATLWHEPRVGAKASRRRAAIRLARTLLDLPPPRRAS